MQRILDTGKSPAARQIAENSAVDGGVVANLDLVTNNASRLARIDSSEIVVTYISNAWSNKATANIAQPADVLAVRK